MRWDVRVGVCEQIQLEHMRGARSFACSCCLVCQAGAFGGAFFGGLLGRFDA